MDDLAFKARFFASIFSKFDIEIYKEVLELVKSGDIKDPHSLLNRFENLDEVSSDFTRLFISDDYYLKAPPYASYYIDGASGSENSIKVAKIYRQAGFIPNFDNFLADYIPNELLFLEFAFKKDKTLAKKFINEQISIYKSKFPNLITKHANSNFYKAMGMFFSDYMEELSKI